MKKVFAITLALLMVAFVFVSCVANSTTETGTESQTVAEETERDTEAATESQTTAATEAETNTVTETESYTETQTETEAETEPPILEAGVNSGIVRDGTPKKYFTLRLDDCTTQDGRIIEIFKRYNFDAVTFYMNTGLFGHDWSSWVGVSHVRYTKAQALEMYAGYDVGVHTVNHKSLKDQTDRKVASEINDDAKVLMNMYGYTPVGMAWPGGDTEWNAHTVNVVSEKTEIKFGSCTTATNNFKLPTQFLTWYPTCHWTQSNTTYLLQQFIDADLTEDMLFYVWGHGYELDNFPNDTGLTRLEQIIKTITDAAAEDPNIVLVTNSEFYQLFKDEIPSYIPVEVEE